VAARKVVALEPRLKISGIAISAVRIDSGGLAALAKSVRGILDAGGLKDTGIFVSGGIDEQSLIAFAQLNAPIDGIGIGTSFTTSFDVPALDCAYKLQEYASLPRRKRSTGKATWPGRKQVWRRYDSQGRMIADTLSTEDDKHEGDLLIHPVMFGGRRVAPQPSLKDVRERARRELEHLPSELSTTKPSVPYLVQISPRLQQLAAVADRRMSLPEHQK
jgi:nicotinate phosphoribosyltransferase